MFALGVNVYRNRKQLDCTLFGLRAKGRLSFREQASKKDGRKTQNIMDLGV